MASQILITMDDLQSAVPLNAALEAGGFLVGDDIKINLDVEVVKQ
jgi:hypothetical protein